jgi:hypothetical protein
VSLLQEKGHYKKECPEWLKSVMASKGNNIVSFVNESLYTQFSKSKILGGLTQVQRFMLQILYRDSVRPGARKEEKVPLKLQMESKLKLKLSAMSLWS